MRDGEMKRRRRRNKRRKTVPNCRNYAHKGSRWTSFFVRSRAACACEKKLNSKRMFGISQMKNNDQKFKRLKRLAEARRRHTMAERKIICWFNAAKWKMKAKCLRRSVCERNVGWFIERDIINARDCDSLCLVRRIRITHVSYFVHVESARASQIEWTISKSEQNAIDRITKSWKHEQM